MKDPGRVPLVDTVAGLPPWLVYAAILLLDLAAVLLLLLAIVWVGDRVEDVIFPGGREWITF